MSSIDDIFASRSKGKVSEPQPAPVQPVASTSSVAAKKKKKKKKPVQDEPVSVPDVPGVETKKRRLPETVVDPSIRITSAASAPPAKKPRVEKMVKKTKGEGKVDDDNKFTDSRGPGSRKKTEEGWTVYKEDELGIQDEGGDTPLCPFDCQCCF